MFTLKEGDTIKTCYVDSSIVLMGKVTDVTQVKRYNEDEIRVYFRVTKVISAPYYSIKVGETKFVFPSEVLEIINV